MKSKADLGYHRRRPVLWDEKPGEGLGDPGESTPSSDLGSRAKREGWVAIDGTPSLGAIGLARHHDPSPSNAQVAPSTWFRGASRQSGEPDRRS